MAQIISIFSILLYITILRYMVSTVCYNLEAFLHLGTYIGGVKTTPKDIGADVCYTNVEAFVKYKSMGSLSTNFGADVRNTKFK